MSARPLTKALHTVRVVERVASYVLDSDYDPAYTPSPYALLDRTLRVLGNEVPKDVELRSACVAACRRAIAEQRA